MSDVLLVNMPFSGIDRPQIGISLLKSALRARGIPCDIRYFNHILAEWLTPRVYQWFSTEVAHTIFAGEWVFAHEYFGDLLVDGNGYLRHLERDLGIDRESIDQIVHLRSFIGPFLKRCLESVDWDRYSIIGFTSTFEQNLAALSLADAVKRLYPDKIVVMGGANCEGPMGQALHRCFPFVDYVFSGEADDNFPELVRRLANHEPVNDIPGIVYRDGRKSVATGPPLPVTRLDRLPFPDYDDFFEQLKGTSIAATHPPSLQIETSRGCWWGAKHHCTFCGLNADTMAFRAKSQERALEEILHLVYRYGVKQISAVDNILDMKYFRNLIPELKRRGLKLSLFYEVKANLSKEQIQMLGEAGVKMIQPGVESLSRNVLQLMRKGVTPLQNVQLLKWCKQFGVRPSWNLLYGFAGETAADYEQMLPIMESLSHLDPPDGSGSVRLDRFSPYFQDPESFGLVNARPLHVYRYLYPIPEEELFDIAYFYDYEFANGLDPSSYIGPILKSISRWHKATARKESLRSFDSRSDGGLVIVDTRSQPGRRKYVLRGWRRELYDFCDQVRAWSAIERWARDADHETTPEEVRQFLDHMVERKLMACEGESYLSLAVPAADASPTQPFLPQPFLGATASPSASIEGMG